MVSMHLFFLFCLHASALIVQHSKPTKMHPEAKLKVQKKGKISHPKDSKSKDTQSAQLDAKEKHEVTQDVPVASKDATPTSSKIPVWILHDYQTDESQFSYLRLNLKALKRLADPEKFELNLVNRSNARS